LTPSPDDGSEAGYVRLYPKAEVAVEMSRVPYKNGYRALAAAMVLHAVKDMRDKGVQSRTQLRYGRNKGELRLEATVWLASKSATWWFEHIEIEQRYGLSKMGWPAHAEELLAAGGKKLGAADRQLLEEGLDVLRPASVSCAS
jgi:hypothetical protein